MEPVYEVVSGEGAGAGHEAERFLPLGTDIMARGKMVQEYIAHDQHVPGNVADTVNIDTRFKLSGNVNSSFVV